MGVRVERFPEYGVTLCVFSGKITPEVVRRHFSSLEPDDVVRRINYADPTGDMSGVDVTIFPELKRVIAARLNALLAGKRGVSAVVSDAKIDTLTLHFWASYVGQDSSFPVRVASFESLEAACAWLGLPEAGCRAVIAAARGEAPSRATPDSADSGAHPSR